MNIQDKLKEMRERCDAATPGKWRVEDYRKDGDWRSTGLVWAQTDEQYYSPGTCVIQVDCRKLHAGSPIEKIAEFEANAAFVCEAKNNIPALLDAIEVCLEALHLIKLEGEMDGGETDEDIAVKAISMAQDILLKAGK